MLLGGGYHHELPSLFSPSGVKHGAAEANQ